MQWDWNKAKCWKEAFKVRIPDNIDKYDVLVAIDRYVIGQDAMRDRQILIRRIIDGVHFEPLAEEFGLSVRRTKDIVYKWQTKIWKHIAN